MQKPGRLQMERRSNLFKKLLKYGIDNLFDKYYREHLNKPSGFDPTSNTPVYEPGRSYWARLEAKGVNKREAGFFLRLNPAPDY